MKGIMNIGNSCYLNSAIQLLFNCKDLVRLINEYSPELTSIINEYYNVTVFNPKVIKNMTGKINKIFLNNEQQDSFEFIVYFLDMIDKTTPTKFHDELYKQFGIECTTDIKCVMMTCLHVSYHKDTELFLQLPITSDLSDSYRKYKATEILNKKNMYFCDNCKSHTIARKQLLTSKWPDNLIVVLKRFDNNMKKNNMAINIPLRWRHNYCLQGGIIHSGSYNSGHYIYYGHDKNNWYEANDSHISIIQNINDYMNSAGCYSYIILYKKLNSILL
jgi:ubiquitin C-terminal hydrolase